MTNRIYNQGKLLARRMEIFYCKTVEKQLHPSSTRTIIKTFAPQATVPIFEVCCSQKPSFTVKQLDLHEQKKLGSSSIKL